MLFARCTYRPLFRSVLLVGPVFGCNSGCPVERVSEAATLCTLSLQMRVQVSLLFLCGWGVRAAPESWVRPVVIGAGSAPF
jgi:hypothetical protein